MFHPKVFQKRPKILGLFLTHPVGFLRQRTEIANTFIKSCQIDKNSNRVTSLGAGGYSRLGAYFTKNILGGSLFEGGGVLIGRWKLIRGLTVAPNEKILHILIKQLRPLFTLSKLKEFSSIQVYQHFQCEEN